MSLHDQIIIIIFQMFFWNSLDSTICCWNAGTVRSIWKASLFNSSFPGRVTECQLFEPKKITLLLCLCFQWVHSDYSSSKWRHYRQLCLIFYKEAGIPRAGWETKGLNFKSSTGSSCSHLPALQHHLQRCCQNRTHCKPREAPALDKQTLAQRLPCSGNCECDSPETWYPSAAR